MPGKQVISDEALSRALGMYAGMVSQVLNNPRRWLGVDEEPPLNAGLPARALDAVRDRALGDVTLSSPHWAEQPESKRVDWWIRRIAVGAALAAATPRFAGALADRIPLQAALGASAAGLAVCAVARERGKSAPADWVPLLAQVIFDLGLPAGIPAKVPAAAESEDQLEAAAADPSEPPSRWQLWPKVRSGSSAPCGASPGLSLIYRICSTNDPAAASSPARWPRCPLSAWPAGGSTNAEPSVRQPDKPND